ncbi:polymorphic toxin type 33 domain-containing protein [Nocardia mangyaensis]|uniref:polymorphic toxin type 33 domain-containing protein n=1 Tax=Nocardia mangyaensis TaxID=2213200 RepID=UPI002675D588|nr:polymorphic toxin type 33 domain-containing protein [Nocardia mangyaensis]MDO3649489.1 polymorphic toxin type 33 domain-containing protein [Nocardia mangyaensis]
MAWTIDSGMYYDAAKKCHLLADDISLALGPLNSALQNECGGMSGDHEKSLPWTTAYDQHASDIVTLTATLANALRRFGDVLEANGYNWWHSNRAKASGSEPARPTESEPLYDSGMALPVTAKGDNGAGLDEGAVVGLLEKVGRIPNGDATKLATARDAWKAFAESSYITGAADRIKGINAKFSGSSDPNIRDLEEKLRTLERAATLVAEAATGIVTPVSEHHTALTDMRSEIQAAVAQAGIEVAAAIGITIAVVAVAAVFTAGLASGGAAAGGAVITIEIVEATALIIKNTVTVSRLLVIFGAVVAVGTATGGFTGIPDLTQAGLSAAVGAIAGMAVYIAAEAADDEPVWDSTEERSRNPAQDKILTDKDIKELKSRGHDPHDVKPEPPSRYDLYKDGKGNVYIKPKGGKGPGDPTGIRLQ